MRSLLVSLLLLAVAACGESSQSLAERLNCTPTLGIDQLLAQPQSALILIDGESVSAAAQAIACSAAARGERVAVAAAGEEAAAAIGSARQLADRGGAVEAFELAAAAAPGDGGRPEVRERIAGEARNAAFAEQVQARGDADRVVIVVDAPDGSRGRVGLSGNTWRPLGARFPEGRVLSLRAESSTRPGIRIRLLPFEDVPVRGAALRYDGVIEVGPLTQRSAASASKGTHAR